MQASHAPVPQLDRTTLHICSAAELVPSFAVQDGTANSPRRREARPHLFSKCGARSSAQVACYAFHPFPPEERETWRRKESCRQPARPCSHPARCRGKGWPISLLCSRNAHTRLSNLHIEGGARWTRARLRPIGPPSKSWIKAQVNVDGLPGWRHPRGKMISIP
jgi:hypothetical protein